MSLDIETLKKEAVPGETVLFNPVNKNEAVYLGIEDQCLLARNKEGEIIRYHPRFFKIKKETPKLYEWAFQYQEGEWEISFKLMDEAFAETYRVNHLFKAKKKLREINFKD